LALIQDYDNHKNIYKREVIASRLISHHDNDFQIYLRVLKKKIITVVLDTDHEVYYRSLSGSIALGLPLLHDTHRLSAGRGKLKRESAAP
jgi:hypothetical protein